MPEPAECVALMRRPCVALVPAWRQVRLRRRVYACEGCRLMPSHCVCGTGALSIGIKLGDAFRKRMLDAMVDALSSLQERHLRVVDDLGDM